MTISEDVPRGGLFRAQRVKKWQPLDYFDSPSPIACARGGARFDNRFRKFLAGKIENCEDLDERVGLSSLMDIILSVSATLQSPHNCTSHCSDRITEP